MYGTILSFLFNTKIHSSPVYLRKKDTVYTRRIHFTFVSCRFCATWVHFFPETFLYFGKMRYSTDPVLLEHEDCMLIPVFY